ncbi:MAG: ATP-grasp domain-containing protein [Muricauda sp. TMED12]|nr:MAG: ATP-grasp domain-containing protein [Muricauda sp. TMED12]|tara:strand:+ start:205130 stop:206101 length:972 start_codon:yes stop_codon:yes gene_type:complete
MNNILLTSVGRRVSLVKFFQDELKAINSDGKLYGTDADPFLSSACRVADGFFKVPRVDTDDYIQLLLEKCKKFNISLIIPTIDTELLVLSKNKSIFEENNIKVVISDIDLIKKCRNKRLTHELFQLKGIGVAKEYDKSDFKLPMFIKPYDGSRSVDTFIINSKEELTEYHFENEKLMFLEYLDHTKYDEYTCDLYYNTKGVLICAVPRQRLLVRDGEVNKGLTKKNGLVPFLKEHMGKVEGAQGCLTTQFFMEKETNEIYGIEINPRFGGGFPLTYLSGANFPKWIIKEYILGEEINSFYNDWEEDLLMLRYDAEVLVHGYKS